MRGTTTTARVDRGTGGALALPGPWSSASSAALAPALAAALAAGAIVLGLRGVDWSAQLYRVHLFQSHGFLSFDAGWYGGQAPLAYSVVFPALAATVSVPVVVVISAASAAYAFDRLVRRHLGRTAWLGSVVFVSGTVVQVMVGQLPFLLGLALALLAVLALSEGRRWLAIPAALACACTSGVAAGFLVLAVVAWAIADPARRRDCAMVAAAAIAPVAALSLAYGQGGSFPFAFTGLGFILGLCAVAWVMLPPSARALRVATVLYAAASVGFFVVQTPMGGNMGRLGTAIGVPLLVSLTWPARRAAWFLLAVPLIGWQWGPAVGAVTTSRVDASKQASYFSPLLAELAAKTVGPARVEIPPTRDHWEATWVAPTFPLARGWERQLDLDYNPLFYNGQAVDPSAYKAWLDTNGVTFVALPDVQLDYSARTEQTLLATPPSYLQRVWTSPHWTLWHVVGSPGLVSGPAQLSALSAGQFTLQASAPGDVIVKVRYSPTWTIDAGAACLTPASGGWTDVRVADAGLVRVVAGILPRSSNAC